MRGIVRRERVDREEGEEREREKGRVYCVSYMRAHVRVHTCTHTCIHAKTMYIHANTQTRMHRHTHVTHPAPPE